jgi:predicted alpha-1,2-mannosidase
VQVKMGLSWVSIEKARENLRREIPGFGFDGVRSRTASEWRRLLETIRVSGGTEEDRTKLYTALYHCFSTPHDLTGDNGLWDSDEPHYEDFFCIWDTFRTLHPLLTLIAPDKQRDMVRSLVDKYVHRGWMPDATVAGGYGLVQGGTNGDVVVADALAKGLEGIDYETAYEALKKNAEVQPTGPNDSVQFGRGGLDDYEEYGYVPVDYDGPDKGQGHYGRSASRTMEYAHNDFCVAQVAKALGRREDYERYTARSVGWRKLWDPEVRSVRPRYKDGAFLAPWDPTQGYYGFSAPFYEGSGYTYSTWVPHDAQGLIDLLGGDGPALSWLDEYFDRGLHDVGNQPGFLAPYLYVHMGRQDKAVDRVRRIMNEEFRTGRSGLPGNDDSGAMSSWYIWGALGLYPNAGQPFYYVGSPIFEEARVSVGRRELRILAPGTGEENRYVQSAKLNGRALDRAFVYHDEISSGGTLELVMGPEPSGWGRTQRPPSVGA